MEVIKGKVLSVSGENIPESPHTVEYLTSPVPVRRRKMPFAIVLVVQAVLAFGTLAFIYMAGESDGEFGTLVKEITGRIING